MIKGPNSEQDKAGWLEFRRGGLTATEIRDLAKGYPSDRTRILQEKVTGERPDLSGNRYVEWGNVREPVIQAWILERYGIQPSADLYAHDEDKRRMATPDGLLVDDFTEEILVAEIKTSKHDLTPGRLDADGVLIQITPGSYFAKSGYYDQMVWQMHVTGASRTLFAWEGHDDDWSGWPERGPVPTEIRSAWIPQDRERLDYLIEVFNEAMAEIGEALKKNLETGEVPDALEPLSEEEQELAQIVLDARIEEAAAKARKERAWKRLQEISKERGRDFRGGSGPARITWTTVEKPVQVFDEEAARAKAPAVFRRYEEIRAKYTTEEIRESSTLTVTAAKD